MKIFPFIISGSWARFFLKGKRFCVAKVLMSILLSSLLLPQVSAWANVVGSPHDLYNQGYLLQKEGKANSSPQCSLCHIVPTDERPRVWDILPESLVRFGPRGNLCASCHDGVSMVDKNVDAALTAFHPYSHGFDPGRAPEDTDLGSSGLPYQPGTPMDCMTCHDPHDKSMRPFLRVQQVGLCVRCHKEREHSGFGLQNTKGNHPVGIEPFDNTEGASPIDLQPQFNVPISDPYPVKLGALSAGGHWILGGHLTYGQYGRIECTTCHAFHGMEGQGPLPGLLVRAQVNKRSNEFCEGCHRGERGDDKEEPPFPNPGGTVTGRTYHPLDDDEANDVGWITAIADTLELTAYQWGEEDLETGLPVMLCTTCHVSHGGMENSPALVEIDEEIKNSEGVNTFCEICHREPPEGHHGYAANGKVPPNIAQQMLLNLADLGVTYGEPTYDRIYCSLCHKAHNAGYNRKEESFIPLLVDKGTTLCSLCHELGVSHFMGDPTLASTYQSPDPPLYRVIWPGTGLTSYYEGEGDTPTTITCESCHSLSTPSDGSDPVPGYLLAPAAEGTEWAPGYPEDYLCTGCHGESPATVGEGTTHPLMDADALRYPIDPSYIQSGETMVTYTPGGSVNCHSCHRAHGAVPAGGVYIMKMIRGNNVDPKAIQPQIDYTDLCLSCHPR
ncbi:MAG: cytochrome c3 family protein [bacterium]|nr:cytochrome c3 family protein [bacterium]MDT8367207.1 cytochrome c3 family protein [bacterium]